MTSRRWIIAAAAFLAAPVLAGCAAGFDANTNQPYAPNEAAALIQDGSYGTRGIKIPQAFVLGPDSGAKLAQGGSAPVYLHVVNTNGAADQLVGVVAEGLGNVKLAAPIALPSNQGVNTGKPTPQIMIEGLTKPLSGGESVKLDLQFANAGVVPVTVPVITRSREYMAYPMAPGATPAPPKPTPSATAAAESGH
ncbi:copper chaperone PCu(A)C [Nonomuraea dietziae]|uniref:Copper(I)-binding protein n=1 Tax=Nonomuraea dietziae TaxID=65515 RepID=A0A7W5VAU8_9ACTN|nr:copper chaperone PCu(A)C [Nonomuraea dietziae]MBB3728788.1 copper(I)-binding protein [Nonomuraea dietziae]